MMSDDILLVLNPLDGDGDRVTLARRDNGRSRYIDIRRPAELRGRAAVEKAFAYAQATGKKIIALQVLFSNLYHWGHSDIIMSGPGKARFLTYIREEVLERAGQRAERLKSEAEQRGVAIEIRSVESDDPDQVVLQEARKGYARIYLPRKKRRPFPLYQYNLAKHLEKDVGAYVVQC